MKIDTKIYLSFLKEMIEQNTDVSIVISGNSMSPFLVNQRHVINLSKINRKLKIFLFISLCTLQFTALFF